MKVNELAKLLGESEQFVRIELWYGILVFDCAIKMSSKWTYHISEAKTYKEGDKFEVI